MFLDKSKIELIYFSWNEISDIPDVTKKFYSNLFVIAPEIIHFFPDDIGKQSDKLNFTLNFLVANLSDPSNIKETIESLGQFHNKLQIEAAHYAKLRIALVTTIKECMGKKYHDEVGEAWDEALKLVSDLMLKSTPRKKKKFFGIIR